MDDLMKIRDFIDGGIKANVKDADGRWSIFVDGSCRLTPDGLARWADVLDCELHLSGKDAVASIIDNGQEKKICSLFNTLAGNVNENVFSKYVVCRKKEGAVKMSGLSSEEIGKCITALEGLVNGIRSDENGNASDESILDMLVKALADEWLASYQYWVCKNLARGAGRVDAIDEFDQHEKDEREHADMLMLRIKELGGKPIFDPAQWAAIGNPWTVVDTESVCRQLDITIKAEQDAIDYYGRVIDACKGKDEVSMRLCRSIMSDECEHLYDLQMLKEEICG